MRLRSIPHRISKLWQSEGWDLFARSDNGLFEIEHFDDPDSAESDLGIKMSQTFESDAACLYFVTAKALAGSKPHMLALWLNGRCSEPKRGWWYIPDVLADCVTEALDAFESLYAVDWGLLSQQKSTLVRLRQRQPEGSAEEIALSGVIHLLDALQDEAAASGRAVPAGESPTSKC